MPNPAASPLTIQLFGPLDVRCHGAPPPRLRSRNGLWLLALLTLRHGREVERTWLAGTLWPDTPTPCQTRLSVLQSPHQSGDPIGDLAHFRHPTPSSARGRSTR